MDREQALDFLCRMAQGLAVMLGPCCETLVHDMAQPGHPIVAIYNSGVSSRAVGCTRDIDGAEPGSDTSAYMDRDFVNHLVLTEQGRSIKSSTFQLRGDNYHFAVGINFDFTAMREVNALLEGMMNTSQDLHSAIDQNAEAQLDKIFDSVVSTIGMPVQQMGKRDRLRVIVLLKQRNAFSFQKSVSYVSQKLGVSRYTVYKYLNEVK